MSELSGSVSSGVVSYQSPWVKVALVASGAVLVAGCSTPEQTPESTHASATPTTTQQETCSPTDTPVSAEEYLCAKRLTGILDIVVATDLPAKFQTAFDYGDPTNVKAFGEYVTSNVRQASKGLISLEPRVIPMSEAAKAEVKKRNPNGCIDSENKAQAKNLGAVVRDMMPETHAATQVMVLGGEACASPNGGDIGGIARYETTARYSDVYNVDYVGHAAKMVGETPLTKAGSRGIHELLHNYGFNHAGVIVSKLQPQTDLTKQSKSVSPLDLMTEAYSFDEYGLHGNAMSNVGCPIVPGTECTPHDILDAVQRDYLVAGSKPEYKSKDLEIERVVISQPEKLIVEPNGHKKGISFPVPAAYEDAMQIDEYRFNRVNFIPDIEKKTVTILLSDERIVSELSTAELVSYQLAEGRPQVFTLDNRELTIMFRDGKAEISAA